MAGARVSPLSSGPDVPRCASMCLVGPQERGAGLPRHLRGPACGSADIPSIPRVSGSQEDLDISVTAVQATRSHIGQDGACVKADISLSSPEVGDLKEGMLINVVEVVVDACLREGCTNSSRMAMSIQLSSNRTCFEQAKLACQILTLMVAHASDCCELCWLCPSKETQNTCQMPIFGDPQEELAAVVSHVPRTTLTKK